MFDLAIVQYPGKLIMLRQKTRICGGAIEASVHEHGLLGRVCRVRPFDKTYGACEMVAKRVIELMDHRRDPEAIRAAVLACFKGRAN